MSAMKPIVHPVDVRLNGIVMQCLRETLAPSEILCLVSSLLGPPLS